MQKISLIECFIIKTSFLFIYKYIIPQKFDFVNPFCEKCSSLPHYYIVAIIGEHFAPHHLTVLDVALIPTAFLAIDKCFSHNNRATYYERANANK